MTNEPRLYSQQEVADLLFDLANRQGHNSPSQKILGCVGPVYLEFLKVQSKQKIRSIRAFLGMLLRKSLWREQQKSRRANTVQYRDDLVACGFQNEIEDREWLHRRLDRLPDRQKLAVEAFWRIDPSTTPEILTKLWNCSLERVRQIKQQGLRALQEHARLEGLR